MDPQKSFCVTPGLEGATVTLTTLMKEICNLVGQGGMPSCDFNLFNRSLTDQHKNAIRMVRKIKYFVARRKFQQVVTQYLFWTVQLCTYILLSVSGS